MDEHSQKGEEIETGSNQVQMYRTEETPVTWWTWRTHTNTHRDFIMNRHQPVGFRSPLRRRLSFAKDESLTEGGGNVEATFTMINPTNVCPGQNIPCFTVCTSHLLYCSNESAWPLLHYWRVLGTETPFTLSWCENIRVCLVYTTYYATCYLPGKSVCIHGRIVR